ncbi:MAG: hypothetical protein ISR65_00685 [Bacteriovoracaceae bacterium]|nr:hypothetical protein [Bacteriovoracaceae bacterium]
MKLLIASVTLLVSFFCFSQQRGQDSERQMPRNGLRQNNSNRQNQQRAFRGRGQRRQQRDFRRGGQQPRRGFDESRGQANRKNPETMQLMKEVRELENKSKQLAQNYKDSNSIEDKKKISESLRSNLQEIFEKKLSFGEKKLDDVAKKLEQLKDSLASRKKNAQQIIKQRLDELLTSDGYAQ